MAPSSHTLASAMTAARTPLLLGRHREGVGMAAPPSAWRQDSQQVAARTATPAWLTGLAATSGCAQRSTASTAEGAREDASSAPGYHGGLRRDLLTTRFKR